MDGLREDKKKGEMKGRKMVAEVLLDKAMKIGEVVEFSDFPFWIYISGSKFSHRPFWFRIFRLGENPLGNLL
uniref:Uncharacterized protein n=1 Tax=Candidatus Kentrum sp. MB TaxID=2138164 RepID=A0A450XR25_9GAMM|nr:MAG: hypothetical protein BECKMB1821G_GA0114241_10919 [Candidatus Kentron sp. MB]